MQRPLVLVLESIHPEGIALLRKSCDVTNLEPGSVENDLYTLDTDPDAIITRGFIPVTSKFIQSSERLRVIAVHGVGIDHIDMRAAAKKKVTVFNTPLALTVSVAELTIGLILALLRKIPLSDRAVREGEWTRKYRDLVGSELAGKQVGIIGMGRIGLAVAERLVVFGVHAQYFDVLRNQVAENRLGVRYATLPVLLASSDIITVHVPLTSETENMLSEKEFASMKHGVYLVNVSRGKVISEEALVKALRHGRVKAAALDVLGIEPPVRDNPLLQFDNVVLTPHIGASTQEAMAKLSVQCAEGILMALNGQRPPNTIV